MVSSDLAARIAAVERNLAACTLCPWRCGVDRLRGELGWCRLGAGGRVFHHYLSFSEELEISPTYEVLFSGCSHRCRFCSVLDYVEDPGRGRAAAVEDVRRGLEHAARRGLRTLSFVGGEPIVNLLAILELLDALRPTCPIVWNSNMFLSPEAQDVLDGLVDVFVADVHWGNDDCARRIGAVAPYFAPVTAAVERAAARSPVILRHLLLPGHLDCCFRPVAAWARERLPEVPFRVLDNFWPNGRERDGLFASALPRDDARRAQEHARRLGLRLVTESADPRCAHAGG